MQQTSFWTALAAYLKSRRHTIVLFALVPLIFLLISALSNVPLEPILYASLLFLTLSVFLFCWRFSAFYQKHLLLTALYSHCKRNLGPLPPASDLLEQDYQALIQALEQSKAQILSSASSAESNALHYYTLWAHQIKTPIAAMRLLLQEGGDWESLGQELFKIEQYVEMVLQYLRLGRLNSDLVLAEHSLSHLVHQAVKKTSTLFIHKRIELSLTLPEGIPTVLTDEKWMGFVLEQLLTNAVKYTPKGTVSLYLLDEPGSQSEDAPAQQTLVIEDTGIGIRQDDLPRVFEWGFTGFNGRSDKRSTGIGLYLCRQITSRLGHRLEIHSTVGKGTQVFLTFSGERLKTD